MNYKLKKISGDASFREFYRLQKGKNTSIIVQAKKEKFKNLITYIVVNKILAKYKIDAPKLITNHYEHNIIEITDLGQKSFYNSIIKKIQSFLASLSAIFRDNEFRCSKDFTIISYCLVAVSIWFKWS